jgi:hypothetical protein
MIVAMVLILIACGIGGIVYLAASLYFKYKSDRFWAKAEAMGKQEGEPAEVGSQEVQEDTLPFVAPEPQPSEMETLSHLVASVARLKSKLRREGKIPCDNPSAAPMPENLTLASMQVAIDQVSQRAAPGEDCVPKGAIDYFLTGRGELKKQYMGLNPKLLAQHVDAAVSAARDQLKNLKERQASREKAIMDRARRLIESDEEDEAFSMETLAEAKKGPIEVPASGNLEDLFEVTARPARSAKTKTKTKKRSTRRRT